MSTDSLWQALIESNVLNFALFAVLLGLLLRRMLPAKLAKKNQHLQDSLAKAQKRYQNAEAELQATKQSLEHFQANLAELKQEQQRVVEALRMQLAADNHKRLERLKEKHSRDMKQMQENALRELKAEIVRLADEQAHRMMRGNGSLKAYDNQSLSQLKDLIHSLSSN